jgi:hypothetical protein
MGRARERGVHPFHMSETIDRALKARGHEGWEKLRNAPDLEQREGEVLAVLEAADDHVKAVRRPEPRRRDAARDRAANEALKWTPMSSQRVFLGHVRPGGEAAPPPPPSPDGLGLGSGPGSEPIDETTGPLGAPDHNQPADERWPPGDERRRIPSLAPPDEATAEDAGEWLVRRSSPTRSALDEAANRPTVWGWAGYSTDGKNGGDNPVVRLYRRSFHLESAWTPGSEWANLRRGWQRVLFRELPRQAARTAVAKGIPARRHQGGVKQHAQDIAEGRRRRSAGLSLTKEPAVAARHAAQAKGVAVCVQATALKDGASAAYEGGLANGSSRRNRRGAPVRSGRKRRLLHGARRTRPRHARRRRQNHPIRRLRRRVATRRPDITTSFAAGRLSTSIAARQRGRRLGRRDRT